MQPARGDGEIDAVELWPTEAKLKADAEAIERAARLHPTPIGVKGRVRRLAASHANIAISQHDDDAEKDAGGELDFDWVDIAQNTHTKLEAMDYRQPVEDFDAGWYDRVTCMTIGTLKEVIAGAIAWGKEHDLIKPHCRGITPTATWASFLRSGAFPLHHPAPPVGTVRNAHCAQTDSTQAGAS